MNLFVGLLFLLFANSDDGSVRFLENPQVPATGEVFLRDIAALEFLAPEDLVAVGNIKIADSYDILKSMSSREIMKKIKPHLRAYENICECKLRVTIPHAMIIRSLPGNFAVEKVRTLLESELKKDCLTCEFDISPLNIIRGGVPEQYTRWNVDLRRNEWRGPSMVRVYFDNDAFSPLVLQSLIKIRRPVLKLRQNINRGSEINLNDFESVMVDVTYENVRYAQASDLGGMEAKRTLGRGSAVVLDDLIARNMVRIGQPVSVEVKNAAFVIEMSGVAQKTGRLGDKIPVRINKTQKSISAEIISEARVRM